MILLVDIGNSNIEIAQYNGSIKETYRYKTDTTKSVDEYYSMLKDILDHASNMVVSSVVPQLNSIFFTLGEKYLNISPLFIGPGIKTGVKLKTDNPKEVGADLVSAAVAIMDQYPKAIIIDMGTATTLTYIENKTITGVSITTGLVTQKEALIGNTSQLSNFEFKTPKSVLGTNTIECLNSGLLLGHTKMIEGLVEMIQREKKEQCKIFLTGGAARFIKDLLPDEYEYRPYLILEGLIQVFNKNN